MNDNLEIADVTPQGSVFVRGLNLLLLAAIGFLALACLGMVIVGISMLFPNSLQDTVFAELQNSTQTASPQKFAIIFFCTSVLTAGYIFVINTLRKIIATLIGGDPFVPANISRLRTVWIALAAFEIFRMISATTFAVEIDALQVSEVASGTIDIRLGTWFLVFVIASLAEVFRHGAVLRRDQEFTI